MTLPIVRMGRERKDTRLRRRIAAPSPLMGEGWDEAETPHLNPLTQGERIPNFGRSHHPSSQYLGQMSQGPLMPGRVEAGHAVSGYLHRIVTIAGI
jgi:hypothetical protein